MNEAIAWPSPSAILGVRFEMADRLPSDTWLASEPDMTTELFGCGFWVTPPSSSRQGTLEILSQPWLISPTLTTSRKRMAESLIDLFRAERRAASVKDADAAENVYELRRLTGFDWIPLADFLNVDRRTLYNWVKGGRVKTANIKHIARTLSVLRYADRGSAEENASAIMERSSVGPSLFEVIKSHQYDDARQFLSHGVSRLLPASAQATWSGEFQSIYMHEDALGNETIEPLPDEPKPVSRKRHVRRG